MSASRARPRQASRRSQSVRDDERELRRRSPPRPRAGRGDAILVGIAYFARSSARFVASGPAAPSHEKPYRHVAIATITTAAGGEAPVVDPAGRSSGPRGSRSGRKSSGHPLDRDRKRPRHAGEHGPARGRQRERGEDEGHHPGVVVAPSRKVDGEQRVPADEGRGERRAAREPCGEQDERDHGRRGQASVEPRRGVRRRSDDARRAPRMRA